MTTTIEEAGHGRIPDNVEVKMRRRDRDHHAGAVAAATTTGGRKTRQADDATEETGGDGKQNATDLAKESKASDELRGYSAGSKAHGYNHQSHNRRPIRHDACAPSSSPATLGSSTPAKTVTISDRVTTSSPRGVPSSTSTPTRSIGGNRTHHTFSPVVNPVLEKKREARRESHRAYLKSNSDYGQAEMKYLSIEAELRLAEFWLDIETKNLEDVGKRIEVHDWNFQKITGQHDADVA
ncbi:hypothetical protein PF010_g6894 [Phytophthora fragariae]|uniref:Uncharacterized protein n=1 Tax=Phytophthora fragariae TaxID=53985 RepID=A0A6G0LJC5_9STRA|nr:hypothetical protein PF010_g6894 [Phytophthora fragariae]